MQMPHKHLTLSSRAWKLLLTREKRRRGVSDKRLLFAGVHNVAQHWWCAEYALQKSWANELMFFRCYIEDRVRASFQLGIVDSLPKRRDCLLELCATLSHEHAESLFQNIPTPSVVSEIPSFNKAPAQTYFDAGERAESLHAERYPRMRWSWSFDSLVLVGIPDGITKDFVYEFKSGKNSFVLNYNRHVARAQCDLYGVLWQRPQKKLGFFARDTGHLDVETSPVSRQNAEKTTRKFYRGVCGKKATPPKRWKCKNCDYRTQCRIPPSK